MKKKAIVSLVGFLIIGATACGSGANPSSPSTPTPNTPLPSPAPAPTPTPSPAPAPTPAPPAGPFTQSWTGTVGYEGSAGWYKFHDLAVPRDGAATLTLTWANAAVDLDLVVTNVGCTYPYSSSCQVHGISESLHNMPERVTRDMKAGETYRVWVSNFGEMSQQYRIDVEIR
jgi:hypothetical protein